MEDADIPTIELGCTLLGAAGQHQLLFMMYTKLLDSINRTAGPYTGLQLDSISNGEVLQVVMSGSSFKENSGRLREQYPSIKWDDYPQEVLRVKIKRLRDRITKLRRNKTEEEISIAMNSKFEFPTPKPNLNSQNLTAETDHLTHDNRALKRQLEAEHDQTENLKIQIEHNERKINLLLESLNIITAKHKSAICQVKDIASLQKESKQWEQKYDEMSKNLDQTLSQLEESKDKLKMLCSRNTNKNLKRRDIKVETLKESLRESECVVEEKEHEIEMNMLACQEKTDDIERLKKDKRNLLVKVCRLNKKSSDEHKSMYEMEIQKLKGEIKQKEQTITELQQINDILDQSEIECFYEGKYSNEIRETIMSLITSGGVSLSKVNEVIQTVVHNSTGRTLSRLPSAGVRSRLYSEAKRVAQVQAVQAMIDNDTSTCSVGNITENSDIFSGNCLHQDGTSKFHRHFQSFQVTTADNTTYSLGLSEVGSADASTLMDAFKEQISDLADAVKTNNEHAVSKLVSSIVSTMSDQGATNPVFNRQLSELKQSVLPDIIDSWDSLSASTKMEVSKISNFFCKMHIFINMASETDKCLVTFENNVCTGRNPYSFEWKESGASRLTRTLSKAFTMHGCEKSGVGSHFSTHLENKKVSNKLITFRGHRFNHLFYAAGATYHHLPDIIDFLDNWAGSNDLLKGSGSFNFYYT